MNRGSRGVQFVLPPDDLASMRPRFMNRGSGYFAKERPDINPGFNEAPIHESGKLSIPGDPPSSTAPLQ